MSKIPNEHNIHNESHYNNTIKYVLEKDYQNTNKTLQQKKYDIQNQVLYQNSRYNNMNSTPPEKLRNSHEYSIKTMDNNPKTENYTKSNRTLNTDGKNETKPSRNNSASNNNIFQNNHYNNTPGNFINTSSNISSNV